MAINVADNFSYKGGKPLDNRTKYSTIASMVATPAADLYDGCLAYVTSTKKNYQYDSTNTVDENLGKWRELQTGGSGEGIPAVRPAYVADKKGGRRGEQVVPSGYAPLPDALAGQHLFRGGDYRIRHPCA